MDTRLTVASGCYPHYPSYPSRTGDPVWREPQTSAPQVPSIMEQMGIDPISKLAAAIEKLADALREGVRE
jgi:hypothetical protein